MQTYNGHETERMHQLHGVELASFKSRFIAFYIDFIIVVLIFAAIVYPGSIILTKLGWIDPKAHIALEFDFHHWYSLVLIVIYYGIFTYIGNGRTPGKRLVKIRVVSLVHEKISLWHSFERALGYGASALEFGFGFIQYFINPNRRTVHDRIAETIVIKEPSKNNEVKINDV